VVIITIKVYFVLLLPATYFVSPYRSHLQAEILLTEEGEIYNWKYSCRFRITYQKYL